MIIIFIYHEYACMYNSTINVQNHPPSAQKQLLVIWFLNACYEKAEK